MTRFFSFALAIMSVFFVGCKSNYSHLKDGLYADIQTNKGNMIVELHYKATPLTVANFVTLAEGKNPEVVDSLKKKPYYNGTIFHRVINNFMIQGGDPTATGKGSPGYSFKDEFVDSLTFNKKGLLAMANSGPATNGSQFFITQVPTEWLNGRHTIFGQVVDGEAIIDTIASVKTINDKPINNVVINKIEIIRKGKDAKKFNAEKIVKNYWAEIKVLEIEKEKIRKKLSQEFISQKEKATALPSGIKILSLGQSKGETPSSTSTVLVNYAGFLANGTIFDTNVKNIAKQFLTYDQRREAMGGYAPMEVPFNAYAGLIPGFTEALLTMKVGDKIRVFIPSNLAYGTRGAGDIIPPNSDLIFDIEIVKIATE